MVLLASAVHALLLLLQLDCILLGIQHAVAVLVGIHTTCSTDEIPRSAYVITLYIHAAVVLVDGEVLATTHL